MLVNYSTNEHVVMASKVASLLADFLHENGGSDIPTAQLLFCRLSDLFLQLPESELKRLFYGISEAQKRKYDEDDLLVSTENGEFYK